MKTKNQEEGMNSFAGGSLQCKMQTVTDFQQGDRAFLIYLWQRLKNSQ